MNDLSLDDDSYKHIVPNPNAPDDHLRPPSYDWDWYHAMDNITSGKNQILSIIRTYLSFKKRG